MWFDKKEQQVPETEIWAETEIQHRTPEQRIEDNEPIQIFEDLDDLDDDTLRQVALQCMTEPTDPDACVSCRAYVMLGERSAQAALDALANPTGAPEPDSEEVPPGALDLTDEEIAELPVLPPVPDEDGNPRLDALMNEPSIFEDDEKSRKYNLILGPVEDDDTDLRQQFIDQVHDLDLAVRRLMEGPPIPPPNVSLEDLALLTIGARQWIKSTETMASLGFGLPAETAKIRDQVSRLLGRMSA